MQHVPGGDEHHLVQRELGVQIVVEERVVLFGVQHLEQRRGRIAAKVGGHLVQLVQQEDRVARPGLAHHLEDLAGESSDVRAPMAADLRLVTYAAERQPHELSSGGAGDGLGQRGLAHSGRPDKAQNGATGLLDQLTNGQELQDPLFDLDQTVVVLVEDSLRPVNVAQLAGLLAPGNREQPLQIVARDRGLRRHGGHDLESLELEQRLLLGLCRHLRLLDLLLELFGLIETIFLASQLLLDRLHLLVQVVLFLRPFHLVLDAAADLAIHLQLLGLGVQHTHHARQALGRRGGLQQGLLLLHADGQVRGDGVAQTARLRNPHGGQHRLVGQPRRVLDVALEQLADALHQLFELGRDFHVLFENLGFDLKEPAFSLLDLQQAGARDALDEQLHVAVGQLEMLDDHGRGSDGVDLVGRRVVEAGVALRRQEELLVTAQRLLDGEQRRAAADDEGHHGLRKDHDVPQWNQRQADHTVIRTLGASRHVVLPAQMLG